MRVGFALRSTVFHPSVVPEVAPLLEAEGVDSFWFPDVGQSFDAVDLCALALGSTGRASVGTGVIRAGEQDPERLAIRARTLAESSAGRFILGLGAGTIRGSPALRMVVELAEKFRVAYGENPPAVYFAALRGGMFRAALSSAQGVILNFCPPSHAERLLSFGRPKGFKVACYVKLFFSQEGDAQARAMLVDEVKKYDRYPSYHAMFEESGLAHLVEDLSPEAVELPAPLREVVLANPSTAEVDHLLRMFVRAGVDLPVIYPYALGDRAYRIGVAKKLASLA